MCLKYKPTVVACFCIHLACRWSRWEVNIAGLLPLHLSRNTKCVSPLTSCCPFCGEKQIPQSTEGKDWFYYVDKSVTMELLELLTDEFIAIYERSPARLKNKLSSTIKDLSTGPKDGGSGSQHRSSSMHHRLSSSSGHHQMKHGVRISPFCIHGHWHGLQCLSTNRFSMLCEQSTANVLG